ncbi:MAG: PQQ-dependent sugar dehydrogenase, partial [Balneolaceae bacterium]|nr:PQQ-dependent sugar dehydrogenase [Balneolaceae bacterium]
MEKAIASFLFLLLLLGCSGTEKADSQPVSEKAPDYTTETVVTGIASPWGMAWLPDGAMLITNRSGELYLFGNGELS